MSSMEHREHAKRIIDRCRELARITDVPGQTTRLFLSPATRHAHTLLLRWMREAGLQGRVDDAGNLRGVQMDAEVGRPRVVLFSHIDTVPNAGAFDGPLGVILGIEAVAMLGERLPINVEVIAFSEEEGIRFGFPFVGSMAVTGQVVPATLERRDGHGVSVAEALYAFGLRPQHLAHSCTLAPETFAALEVHIEQGPVLENEDQSLAVVEAIVGQSRFELTFTGQANHAGTTPMRLRHDALAAAAQWVTEVERYAGNYQQLVATVGELEVCPGAVNVVPGIVRATLDVRHPKDESRHAAVANLLTKAELAAAQRGVLVSAKATSKQNAVEMDRGLTIALQDAAARAGYEVQAMFSGAGHDAMILAPHLPTAMLFVRSPGGLSHHPEESVRVEDVEAALATVIEFLRDLKPPSR
ncbi:MAG TPA: allantoate amidohydrolase [Acidobacteriaceae bacterium]